MELLIVFLIAFAIGASFLIYKILKIQDREIEGEREKTQDKKSNKQFITFNSRKNEIVRVNSEKVRDLIALNESTNFHTIRSSFEFRKKYDNKAVFNKIEPAFLMSADIRENLDEYAKYIARIKENREIFADYQKKVNELFQKKYPVDVDSLGMSLDHYHKCEEQMFNEIKLKPVVDCLYSVRISYSSPQGRVYLHKEDVFNFDDVFACFESVSRSHLDRDTYQKLAAVERGKVSDSLRYDIMNRDNFTCVLCGASARQGARLHVDHIIPIAKGGKSIPSNLRTLCERCNVGKSDKIEGISQTPPKEQNDELCKWCGGKLVLRQGKNGEFYGCSNYPKCRYTRAK